MEVGLDRRIGEVVAGYRIEALLRGGAGVGIVYRARELRLDRRVALRLLSPGLGADGGFRERFLRESELAGSIEHPHVVSVYGAGEAEGLLFVAMGYVEGEDLVGLLAREGRLEPGRALRIVAQLAEALDTARWARGLVHGCVGPAEVLVVAASDAGSGERVLLSGFGLRWELSPGVGLGEAARALGSVGYPAPEQIEGRSVSPRTDVYGLGCLLFECLTGKPPFRAGSPEALLRVHLHERPPPVTRSQPELPAGIDRVIERALAKRPEERHSTCGELAVAAQTALKRGRELPERATSEGRPAAVPVQPRSGETPSEQTPPSPETDVGAAVGHAPLGQRLATRRKPLAAVGLVALLAALVAGLISLTASGSGEVSPAAPASPSAEPPIAPAPSAEPEAERQPSELSPPVSDAEPAAAEPRPIVAVDQGSLVRIDATSGEILALIAIPDPELLATDGRSVWVGRSGATLVRVDAATNALTASFDTTGVAVSGLAAIDGAAWLSDIDGALYRLAPGASAAEPVTLDDPDGGGSMDLLLGSQVAAAGSLWLAAWPSRLPKVPGASTPSALYRVDPETGRVIARVEGASTGVVAAGPGFVWAFDDIPQSGRWAEGGLVRIDPGTNAAVPIGVLESCCDFTVARGAVWASSQADGTIVRLDPLTGEELERIPVGPEPFGLTAGKGAVWAALNDGTVARYDIATGRVETIDVGGNPRDLVLAHDSIWVAVSPLRPEAYRTKVEAICTAAHARLNRELQAAGIELETPGGASGSDGDFPLYVIPTSDEDWVAYDKGARRIMARTLRKLRALPLPGELGERYEHLYGLMEEFAKGEDPPFTPGEYWVHQIDGGAQSLSHCTFALPR